MLKTPCQKTIPLIALHQEGRCLHPIHRGSKLFYRRAARPVSTGLLLRMLVRGLAVPVRVLAVVVCRGSMLLRFIVIALIVMMGSLAMVMRRRFMLRGSIVMMLAGYVLLFL
jgi:hypothetical protein